MTLEQLEAISAVAEFGSFRAAAERLNRSQPAVSTTIKNLEEEFELLIFDRSDYRPRLTEAGAAFLNVARLTLASSRHAARVAQELGRQKAETRLNVSVDALVSVDLVALLSAECSRPTLPVNLVLEKTVLKSCHQALLDGKIDLALAPCPMDDANVEKIPLQQVRMIGAVSRNQPTVTTDADLATIPQVVVYDRHFDEAPDELLPDAIKAGTNPKIFVPDHGTKLKLVAGGIGWGRVSEDDLGAQPELVAISNELCAPVSLQLCLLRAKHRAIGPVARAIWKSFEQHRALLAEQH